MCFFSKFAIGSVYTSWLLGWFVVFLTKKVTWMQPRVEHGDAIDIYHTGHERRVWLGWKTNLGVVPGWCWMMLIEIYKPLITTRSFFCFDCCTTSMFFCQLFQWTSSCSYIFIKPKCKVEILEQKSNLAPENSHFREVLVSWFGYLQVHFLVQNRGHRRQYPRGGGFRRLVLSVPFFGLGVLRPVNLWGRSE